MVGSPGVSLRIAVHSKNCVVVECWHLKDWAAEAKFENEKIELSWFTASTSLADWVSNFLVMLETIRSCLFRLKKKPLLWYSSQMTQKLAKFPIKTRYPTYNVEYSCGWSNYQIIELCDPAWYATRTMKNRFLKINGFTNRQIRRHRYDILETLIECF